MIYVYDITSHALGEYRNAFKKLLKNELKDEKTLYTDMISGKKGEKLIRWYYYNMNRFNKLFYSDLSNYQTLFFMQKNDKFHILQSLDKNHKIVLSHCYHEISEKLFLRYCQYFGEEKNVIDIPSEDGMFINYLLAFLIIIIQLMTFIS